MPFTPLNTTPYQGSHALKAYNTVPSLHEPEYIAFLVYSFSESKPHLPQVMKHMMRDTMILAHGELFVLSLTVTLIISPLRYPGSTSLRFKHRIGIRLGDIRYTHTAKCCIESHSPEVDHPEGRQNFLLHPFEVGATP